jgi:hypothetical protein
MAETYKILGQIATSDTTEQELYTSPNNAQTIVTNITAVNRTNTPQTFDVNVSKIPVSSLFAKYIAFGDYSAINSTDGITWTQGLNASLEGQIGSIAQGNGTFVGVQEYANWSFFSTNGINWTSTFLPAFGRWTGVTYGNGVFVSVSYATSTAASSTDGITWTLRTLSGTCGWRSVNFVNNLFIAVGPNDSLGRTTTTSTDGITWTNRTMSHSGGGIYKTVAFGNSVYVAVANGNIASTSTDGITWTQRTLPESGDWSSLAFGNGVFVSGTGGSNYPGKMMTSTNGIAWTIRTIPGSLYYIRGLSFINNTFIALSEGSNQFRSTDGITWTYSSVPYGGYKGLSYSATSSFTSPASKSLYKNITLAANSSRILEPGIVLGASNSITVKGTANTTFSTFGVEIS